MYKYTICAKCTDRALIFCAKSHLAFWCGVCYTIITEGKKGALKMIKYTVEKIEHKNAGIAREWAFGRHYMIERTTHDNVAYNKGSDFEIGTNYYSVKASGASLMAGNLCNGIEDFDGIWNLYETNVHSNIFVYMTNDFVVYEMNIAEFKKFVYAFAHIERESEKNGGAMKIRLRKESGKMLKWLDNMVA